MFTRICPNENCKKVIVYKSSSWRDLAESRRTKCASCRNSGESNTNYGKVSVLRGKKWHEIRTAEGIKLGLESCRKGLYKGFKHTQETKDKIRAKTAGSKNGFYGKTHSREVRDRVSKGTLRWLNKKLKRSSKIESLFELYLQELKINYRKQEIFAFWSFDFYLFDYDIYIECDGDYWHCNPDKNYSKITLAQRRNIGNDKRKNLYMERANKLLLRFWESDIKNDRETIVELLKTLKD